MAGSWNLDPVLLTALALVSAAYAIGVTRVWRRAGAGSVVRGRQVAAFASGVYALLVAVVSPLDAVAHVIFSAHMAQHMLLMFVAAPLLVYGAPVLPLLWSLPRRLRLRLGRWYARTPAVAAVARAVGHPVVAWCVLAGTLWGWHHPSLYQAAVRHGWVHGLEHATLLAATALFWWVVLQPQGRRSVDRGSAVMLVFATKVQSATLGVMITFGPSPLYPIYEAGAALYGLTPREDQQLAGLIMSVPTGLVFLVSGALLFLAWLREIEARGANPGGPPAYARAASAAAAPPRPATDRPPRT